MKRLLAVAAVLGVIAAGLPLILLVSITSSARSAEAACAPSQAGTVTTTAAGMSSAQLAIAGQTVSIGQTLPGIGAPGEVVALAAGLVESDLTNLVGGDRDSAGVWQMRPSQGWGTYAQVTDVTYAAHKFFSVLAAVPGWPAMANVIAHGSTQDADTAAGDAAQAVERSAYPDRYAVQVPLATQLVTNAVGAPNPVVLVSCGAPEANGGANEAGLPAAVRSAIASASPTVQTVIAFALSKIGMPYQWGGTGDPSYDCSGLTQAAYAAAGISIPRLTYGQIDIGTPVDQFAIQPGDLIFPNDGPGGPEHVQLALGAGWVVEAPSTGLKIRAVPMWGFAAARRVVG